MDKTLEQRVEELEKRIAELEGSVQGQQNRKFIPETGSGTCKDPMPCKCQDR